MAMHFLHGLHLVGKMAMMIGALALWRMFPNQNPTQDVTLDIKRTDVVLSPSRPCPCKEIQLCERVSVEPEKEVFLFSVTNKNWRKYDWTKVTTIVEFGYLDDELMCYAHSKDVRILFNANVAVHDLTNVTARRLWVDDKVAHLLDNHLDGVNVDFESAIPEKSEKLRSGLTQYMTDLTVALKSKAPRSVVTMDFAWQAKGVDDRFYDYKTIADVIDMVFVMAYDERSQITGDCIAWANSGRNNTQWGIETYLQLGIPSHKLILGVPWYGYRYPCVTYNKANHRCEISHVPFRGVNCSDAAGREVDYSQIDRTLLPLSFTGRLWDDVAQSPYFSMKDEDTGQVVQVWYDDPQSLSIKYQLVREQKLRGLGMWTVDSLDYADPDMVRKMWSVIP